MKQLLILSGKGGTGKTTVASAFVKLSKAKAYADCDVDAPNLHLVMNLNNPQITDKIETYCNDNNIEFIGKIPFDINAVKAINNGYTIVDIDCAAGLAVEDVYNKTINILYD
jgi:MinD superfamily P-loop ATPase